MEFNSHKKAISNFNTTKMLSVSKKIKIITMDLMNKMLTIIAIFNEIIKIIRCNKKVILIEIQII